MKRIKAGVPITQLFPYTATFTCPDCYESFQLEVGDLWDRVNAHSGGTGRNYACATCPNPDCGARVCLEQPDGLGFAAAPKPAPATFALRQRERRHYPIANRAAPLPDDDEQPGIDLPVDQLDPLGVTKSEHGRGG